MDQGQELQALQVLVVQGEVQVLQEMALATARGQPKLDLQKAQVAQAQAQAQKKGQGLALVLVLHLPRQNQETDQAMDQEGPVQVKDLATNLVSAELALDLAPGALEAMAQAQAQLAKPQPQEGQLVMQQMGWQLGLQTSMAQALGSVPQVARTCYGSR